MSLQAADKNKMQCSLIHKQMSLQSLLSKQMIESVSVVILTKTIFFKKSIFLCNWKNLK